MLDWHARDLSIRRCPFSSIGFRSHYGDAHAGHVHHLNVNIAMSAVDTASVYSECASFAPNQRIDELESSMHTRHQAVLKIIAEV